jgi:riboflavin biosynthesis pyrimidine reductase
LLGDVLFPDDDNLAALVAMCSCPEVFESQSQSDAHEKKIGWEKNPLEVILDRKKSMHAALEVVRRRNSLVPLVDKFLGEIKEAMFGC